jgi:hypothetical protein
LGRDKVILDIPNVKLIEPCIHVLEQITLVIREHEWLIETIGEDAFFARVVLCSRISRGRSSG